MKNYELEDQLVVGAKIKIGKKYAERFHHPKEGEIIELIEGYFEYDNGLYVEDQACPSMLEEDGDFSSIYHLFGNNLEDFMDCEIVKPAA